MGTRQVSASLPSLTALLELRADLGGRLNFRELELWGLSLVTPSACPHLSQGSSDFCVDPDTYVTRMVEEHSVLSGGESAAGTPVARLGRPN